MYDTQYYLNILNNNFISEIDIPNRLLDIAEILEIIINKKWFVFPGKEIGWAILKKDFNINN